MNGEQPRVRLRCKLRENPIGVAPDHVRFSWKVEGQVPRSLQSGYQVLGGESTDALDSRDVVWDSGRVASSNSTAVGYEGAALLRSRSYFWKVRVFDHSGAASTWSDAASFEVELVAYRLLEQDSFSSLLYTVDRGATTIWERWDGWTEERGFQSPEIDSFNQYALGSVGDCLDRFVLGIELALDTAGFEQIALRLHRGARLPLRAAMSRVRAESPVLGSVLERCCGAGSKSRRMFMGAATSRARIPKLYAKPEGSQHRRSLTSRGGLVFKKPSLTSAQEPTPSSALSRFPTLRKARCGR